jgi:hypothetical protein
MHLGYQTRTDIFAETFMKAFLKISGALLLILTAKLGVAQNFFVVKDLKPDWQLYEDERYSPFNSAEQNVTTIYFWVEPAKFAGHFLKVKSNEPFALFINGQLVVGRASQVNFGLDSIRQHYPAPVLLIGVHQQAIRKGGLETLILSPAPPVKERDELPLRFASFRDFAIVGILILISVLIIVAQLNPKLAWDYFSVFRIFFTREGEDSQIYSRITSSINILFYVYCSLMIGYYLMIIFRFIPSHYVVALAYQTDSFGTAMLLWTKLSGIVLAIIFLKVVLVYCLSVMFGFTEIAGIHIFNWIRLLLVFFGTLTVILFFYFVLHGQNENFHIVLLKIISWLLVGWMLLIILKLRRRMGHSMFHLFSYICATELIPLLITIKILYT